MVGLYRSSCGGRRWSRSSSRAATAAAHWIASRSMVSPAGGSATTAPCDPLRATRPCWGRPGPCACWPRISPDQTLPRAFRAACSTYLLIPGTVSPSLRPDNSSATTPTPRPQDDRPAHKLRTRPQRPKRRLIQRKGDQSLERLRHLFLGQGLSRQRIAEALRSTGSGRAWPTGPIAASGNWPQRPPATSWTRPRAPFRLPRPSTGQGGRTRRTT